MPADRIYLIEQARAGFREHFGCNEAITVQSPGRVNLLGEHTDYNDGFVLPCAIDFYTIVCASPRADGEVNVLAMNYNGETDSFSVNSEIDQHPDLAWSNYVRGRSTRVVRTLTVTWHSVAIYESSLDLSTRISAYLYGSTPRRVRNSKTMTLTQ